MQRRLAAILAADVVGYGAHIGRDEEATIRTLKAHIGVMEPMIGLHAGRVFKTTGDGFLAEFGSVVDAVSCAQAMQRQMAERNSDQADDLRLDFRMGVHAGDIIVDGDDILGDGVNLAARLEGLARPGGVAVSALETTPTFAKAMALKAWLGTVAQLYGRHVTEQARADSLELAMAALELNSADAEVAAYAGYTLGFCGGGLQRGLRLVEFATTRCPSFAWALASSGLLSVYAGHSEQAIRRAETALRLSPRDPSAFRAHVVMCLAAIMRGDMEMLLESAGKGADVNPRAVAFLRNKAIALTELGRADEAARERQRHMDAQPGFNLHDYIKGLSSDIPVVEALWRPMRDYLRKAGFPEQR